MENSFILTGGKVYINHKFEDATVYGLDISKEAINMVEAGAQELSEEEMLDALMFGHEAIKKLCAWQKEIIAEIGREKRVIELYQCDPEIEKDITDRANDRLKKAISIFDKLERQDAIDAIENEIIIQ